MTAGVAGVPAGHEPAGAAAARACRVARLRLFRFRNYGDATVELDAGVNLITGANAQGKTNLLEALATLSLTRSPRTSSIADLIRWGDAEARVVANVDTPAGSSVLDLSLSLRDGQALRRTLVDGRSQPARAVVGRCPVVLFWTEDLLLVRGGPEGRRRLLDMTLCQTDPRATADLARFRRVLDQRNALLRAIRQGRDATAGLAAFTHELATVGGRIRVARARLVAELEPLATEALLEISGGHDRLALRYQAAGASECLDADLEAEALARALAERSAEEQARGTTVAGPHRDDIEVLVNDRAARVTASQGQQRSAVLACKLAELRHVTRVLEMTPVLLLDDVLSELDASRRRQLFDALGHGPQTLVTTTDPAPPLDTAFPSHRHLTVSAGEITVTTP